jgi:hypothetical protein
MLLKQQRNELYHLIVKRGLNPKDFSEYIPDKVSYSILLNGTDIDFCLRNASNKRWEICASPSPQREISPDHFTGPYDWNTVTEVFSMWTDAVKEEVEAPDLWAEISGPKPINGSTHSNPEEKFDGDGFRKLQARIRELEKRLSAAELLIFDFR